MKEERMDEILEEAVQSVILGLSGHAGVESKVVSRGKFELFFHLELIKELKALEKSISVWSEVELLLKTGKKGRTVDLVIEYSGCYHLVEVKMILSNYEHDSHGWVRGKTVALTDAIDGFIHDVFKSKGESLVIGPDHQVVAESCYSVGVVYPMPISDAHQRRWQKQVDKMNDVKGASLMGNPTAGANRIQVSFSQGSVPFGWYLLKSD